MPYTIQCHIEKTSLTLSCLIKGPIQRGFFMVQDEYAILWPWNEIFCLLVHSGEINLKKNINMLWNFSNWASLALHLMPEEVLTLLIVTVQSAIIFCNIFIFLPHYVQVFQMHLYLVVSTSKTLCDCIVNVPNIHFTWAFLNHGLSNQKK